MAEIARYFTVSGPDEYGKYMTWNEFPLPLPKERGKVWDTKCRQTHYWTWKGIRNGSWQTWNSEERKLFLAVNRKYGKNWYTKKQIDEMFPAPLAYRDWGCTAWVED